MSLVIEKEPLMRIRTAKVQASPEPMLFAHVSGRGRPRESQIKELNIWPFSPRMRTERLIGKTRLSGFSVRSIFQCACFGLKGHMLNSLV